MKARDYARLFGLVGGFFMACGGSADLSSNSETHFLDYCEGECGDAFDCVCGVCTVTCDPAASCGDLNASAICRSVNAADAPSCGEQSHPSVCDVPCSVDADCSSLSHDHRCVDGFCRRQGCFYQGTVYAAGDSFPAAGAGSCNTCTCTEGGQVICTRSACPGCEYDGVSYVVGESFEATDGCNTCSCEAPGTIVCTERGCGAGGTGGAGSGSSTVSTGGGAGATSSCFSPTQNLDTAYDGGTGCPCGAGDHARCIEGVALVCEGEQWTAVIDGPCEPSRCTEPLEVDSTCEVLETVRYWHNSRTGQCEPYRAGCPRNDNDFASLDECVDSCQDQITLTAVVPWDSCEGLGDQITQAGSESMFSREGALISAELFWGCGCATRPEFVLAYEPVSPVRLRLCHDDLADSCEAGCSRTVSFDLSDVFAAVGTDEFEFVD